MSHRKNYLQRTAGTKTPADVLRSAFGKGRSSDEDIEAIESGASMAMTCVPVIAGARAERGVVRVSLAPGEDWFRVFGHPPYTVFEVRKSKPWVDTGGFVEAVGRSRDGSWQTWIPRADVRLLRSVLIRLTARRVPPPDGVLP